MHSKTLVSKIAFLLLVTFYSCAQQKPNSKKELATELDALFSKKFKENEPGAAVLLIQGENKLFEQGYGIADLKTKEKITANTVFNTGSISKTFVANGILILQEKGLLSVEDSIYKYFPDFNNIEIAKKVKIKHMLSHTSGLPDLRDVRNNIEFYITAKDTANFAPTKRADSLIFQPGEKYMYSNPSYNGLALIIEQLANQKWQQFIIDRIFKPSGMGTSKITDGDHPNANVAHAYIQNETGAFEEYDYGGVWSSVNELAKYEVALRNHTFLSKETIEKSRTVFKPKNWADSIPPNVGYSWFLDEEGLVRVSLEKDFQTKIVSHTGSQGGFRAFLISFPEKELTYIMLSNRPFSGFSDLIKDSLSLFHKYGLIE
ncbi:serine hydrolase domain-containing protein [Aquimarina gracilis]|uniref:Serine hydrolase domain-containing protein n=1 Tax=Aquimarina gracilis TaxID=874422 RepID=A0ABU5ZUN2_9FLAO|nr:serine hydrolase domain-containing protein [Aquimarina gracilis]MEB3345595.1 serine hydrolase domain-containing protein [Aquimarina gracilis]